jgi:hypothetical protein
MRGQPNMARAYVFLGPPVKHVVGQKRQASAGTRQCGARAWSRQFTLDGQRTVITTESSSAWLAERHLPGALDRQWLVPVVSRLY